MENYNLLLKKFEELVEESYENLIEEQLNHPSMSDEVLGGTLLYGLILSHGKTLKENLLGNISDQYNLSRSDLEDVIDKVNMKMLKKYFDNFERDEPKVLDPLLADYDEEFWVADYDEKPIFEREEPEDYDPFLELYGEEPIVERETPIDDRKPTKNKQKSNFFLYVLVLVLLFGLGYYVFSEFSKFFKDDKKHTTNELNTEVAPQKNDSDSTLTLSQDGYWFSNIVKINEFRNGEKIFEVSSKAEWDKACANKIPAYCHVNYDSSNDEKYGLLYNWYALTDERNICPEGCRLPKKSDFEILIFDSIEKNRILNLKMNLPGYRDFDGYFKAHDELLVIWSSQERFSNCIEALVISKNRIKMECYSPCQAYSIRFIKTDK